MSPGHQYNSLYSYFLLPFILSIQITKPLIILSTQITKLLINM